MMHRDPALLNEGSLAGIDSLDVNYNAPVCCNVIRHVRTYQLPIETCITETHPESTRPCLRYQCNVITVTSYCERSEHPYGIRVRIHGVHGSNFTRFVPFQAVSDELRHCALLLTVR